MTPTFREEVDAGGAITLVFDTPTDLGVSPPQRLGDGVGGGAVSGGKAYVDSLFRFCETACDTTARMDTTSPTTTRARGPTTRPLW